MGVNIALTFISGFLLCVGAANAAVEESFSYENFYSIRNPIFASHEVIETYFKKDIGAVTSKENGYIELDDKVTSSELKNCLSKNTKDGWVYCPSNVGIWLKRDSFVSAEDILPVEKWPFRYWLHVAGFLGGEEEEAWSELVYFSLPKDPYLIKPKAIDVVFFLVYFDEQGFAFSPKTRKKTGERIYLRGDEVFLAAANPRMRQKSKWSFIGFYNKELDAICPGRTKESCMSSVNLSPDWHGIKQLYEAPSPEFSQEKLDPKREWQGAGEVAFARHRDPIVPFLFKLPENASSEGHVVSNSQRKSLREKLSCIADCKKVYK